VLGSVDGKLIPYSLLILIAWLSYMQKSRLRKIEHYLSVPMVLYTKYDIRVP